MYKKSNRVRNGYWRRKEHVSRVKVVIDRPTGSDLFIRET